MFHVEYDSAQMDEASSGPWSGVFASRDFQPARVLWRFDRGERHDAASSDEDDRDKENEEQDGGHEDGGRDGGRIRRGRIEKG